MKHCRVQQRTVRYWRVLQTYCRILLGSGEYCKVLQGKIKYFNLRQGTEDFYMVLYGATKYHRLRYTTKRVLHSNTGYSLSQPTAVASFRIWFTLSRSSLLHYSRHISISIAFQFQFAPPAAAPAAAASAAASAAAAAGVTCPSVDLVSGLSECNWHNRVQLNATAGDGVSTFW